MATILTIVVSILAAAGLAEALRRAALATSILDIPNERSSHVVPTPRGAGLGIVLAVVTCAIGAAVAGKVPVPLAASISGGGLAIAVVGFVDDYVGMTARGRLLVHFAAAVWAVAWLGGMPQLLATPYTLHLGIVGWLVAVVAIVWLTNLYNFMDGTDALAGVEAASAAGVAALFIFVRGRPDLALLPAVLAAACVGFLARNWPPARVFMGDVGSGFIGYCFGVFALASERAQVLPVFVWLTLLGIFVVDATATLIRRLMNGERVYAAHRTHSYQRLNQLGWPHGRIAGYALALNIVIGICIYLVLDSSALLMLCCAVIALMFALYFAIQYRSREAQSEAAATAQQSEASATL